MYKNFVAFSLLGFVFASCSQPNSKPTDIKSQTCPRFDPFCGDPVTTVPPKFTSVTPEITLNLGGSARVSVTVDNPGLGSVTVSLPDILPKGITANQKSCPPSTDMRLMCSFIITAGPIFSFQMIQAPNIPVYLKTAGSTLPADKVYVSLNMGFVKQYSIRDLPDVLAAREIPIVTNDAVYVIHDGKDSSPDYLIKYDQSGNFRWGRDIPISGDVGGMAVTDDGIYLSSNDSVLKCDLNGILQWTKKVIVTFGTTGYPRYNSIRSLIVDTSGIYVTGYTNGVVSGGTSFGSTDAFVIKYDHAGNQLWVNQFGTSSDDTAEIAKIGSDGVYIFGSTDGSFPMEVNYGRYDVFIAKLDFNTGNIIKISQSGTSENESVSQVEAAADGFYVLNQDGKSAISKYGFDGRVKWTNTDFSTVLSYTLEQISIGRDGLYVVGNRLDTGGFVVKLDLITGKTTSLQSIGDSYYESTAVNVGTDGYVYVVGRQALGHPVDNNMVIIKYSPTLSSYQWLERVHASIPSVSYSQILPLSLVNGANGMYVFGTTWGSLSKTAFDDKTVFVAKIPY